MATYRPVPKVAPKLAPGREMDEEKTYRLVPLRELPTEKLQWMLKTYNEMLETLINGKKIFSSDGETATREFMAKIQAEIKSREN